MPVALAVMTACGQRSALPKASALATSQSPLSWILEDEVSGKDGQPNDAFGSGVALDDSIAVVGAMQHQVGSAVSAGVAYVFAPDAGAWTQGWELAAADAAKIG